jgi:hypothetical protein
MDRFLQMDQSNNPIRQHTMRFFFHVAGISCLLCCFFVHASAQDTLPHFQVFNTNGRIYTAFYNPYVSAAQVNIERSYDSTKNFTTIYAIADPKQGRVTFMDAKAPNDHMYYRIFIQLTGRYSFTPSQQPVIMISSPILSREEAGAASNGAERNKKPEWVPSIHVFTDDYGNVKVELPPPFGKKYEIKFFDDQNNPVFELNDIVDLPLTLDKSNFLHAGWFFFELYINGVLSEKNKFLLSKDN